MSSKGGPVSNPCLWLNIIFINYIVFQSMCSEDDLKDLGLPMGPRKKLKGLLKEENERKVCIQ